MAVGNMYQRGYPSYSMTGGHDSVMSICLIHAYTSSYHKSDETRSAGNSTRARTCASVNMQFGAACAGRYLELAPGLYRMNCGKF